MYIYRKSDLAILSGIQDVSQLESVYDTCLKPNYGGKLTDYGTIVVNYNRFHLERNEAGEVIAVEDGLTVEEQRQTIINQLAELDKSLTRTEENIISHLIDTTSYQPCQREFDIANQKQALRQQLHELEV